MKLVENYALQLGQKIDKIHTIEKYFPLPFEDFIVFAPYSKPSKNYDTWLEVLSLIHPILEKQGIKIVQAGAKGENGFPQCYQTQGNTNFGQLEYLISKSKLVLSTDSIAAHLAGHYNKELVVLISNNFSQTVSPYFGDKNKQIILEPDRSNKNPSFMLDEGPNKQINEICPIKIAESALKLLNIPYTPEYKTLQISPEYKNRIIESSVDCVIDTNKLGLQTLIMRLDYCYNLDILFKQAQITKVSIVTDKELPIEPLQQLRPNIIEVLFKVTKENNNPQFIKNLQNAKIPYRLFSYMSDEDLNPLKLDYLDASSIIHRKEIKIPEVLKDKDFNKIFYKSSKFILGKGNIYSSFFDYKSDRSIPSFEPVPLQLLDVNLGEIFCDSDYIYLLEKIT